MSAGAARVGLIQSYKPPHVAKEFHYENGRLIKRAAANIVAGLYWSKYAATAEELAAILGMASERSDCCLMLDTLIGDDGRPVDIVSEFELARRTGYPPGDRRLAGIQAISGGTVAARLKRSLEPGGWMLVDADNPPGMPDELKALTLSERLMRLAEIIPGLANCERIEMRSSSARVRHGSDAPGGASHAYIRVGQPARIELVRVVLDVETRRRGLAFPSPRYDRTTGKVIGKGWRTLIDLAVLVTGRLIFVARPILAQDLVAAGWCVHPADVRIVNAGAGMLDLSKLELPGQRALEEAASKTGSRLSFAHPAGSGGVSGLVLRERGMLTLDTPIERRGTVRPLGAWLAGIEPGGLLRCETPFRASQSEAAFVRRTRSDEHGDGCVLHDVGTSTSHFLSRSAAIAIGDVAALGRPIVIGTEEGIVRGAMAYARAEGGLVWPWGWEFAAHMQWPRHSQCVVVAYTDDLKMADRLALRLGNFRHDVRLLERGRSAKNKPNRESADA